MTETPIVQLLCIIYRETKGYQCLPHFPKGTAGVILLTSTIIYLITGEICCVLIHPIKKEFSRTFVIARSIRE